METCLLRRALDSLKNTKCSSSQPLSDKACKILPAKVRAGNQWLFSQRAINRPLGQAT